MIRNNGIKTRIKRKSRQNLYHREFPNIYSNIEKVGPNVQNANKNVPNLNTNSSNNNKSIPATKQVHVNEHDPYTVLKTSAARLRHI